MILTSRAEGASLSSKSTKSSTAASAITALAACPLHGQAPTAQTPGAASPRMLGADGVREAAMPLYEVVTTLWTAPRPARFNQDGEIF